MRSEKHDDPLCDLEEKEKEGAKGDIKPLAVIVYCPKCMHRWVIAPKCGHWPTICPSCPEEGGEVSDAAIENFLGHKPPNPMTGIVGGYDLENPDA